MKSVIKKAAHLCLYIATLMLSAPASSASFAPADSMTSARDQFRATTLVNGQVLITGSSGLSTAELLDPVTGKYTSTGSMNAVRNAHTATRLLDGRVLVVGGGNYLSSAEIYDPATKTFYLTGSMSIGRTWHAATLLNDGRVLVTGGYSMSGGSVVWGTNTAEIYDPSTGVFTVVGSMLTSRCQHISHLLPNGGVLVAAGWSASGGTLVSAEIFNPSTNSFTQTGSLNIQRRNTLTSSISLSDGSIFVAGGYNDINGHLTSAEIYNPSTGAFSLLSSLMGTGRYDATTVLLPSGKILVVGGSGPTGALASSEIFNPATQTFSAGPIMTTARRHLQALTLSCWSTVVLGGNANTASAQSSTERFCE